MASIADLRKAAELYQLVNGNYETANAADDSITKLVDAVAQKVEGTRVFCAVVPNNGDSWAFAAPLQDPESGTTGWCIDSSGAAKAVTFSMTGPGNYLRHNSNTVVYCP